MIVLYQLPGAWGASSVSPFCIKLEAFLKLAEVPYQSAFGDPRKAPRGKVPWIDDEGTLIADSQRIIEHLVQRHRLTLDDHLTRDQKTHGHALRRMIEEGTYFSMVYGRWGDDTCWAAYKPVFDALLPPVIGGPIIWMVRRQMLKQLYNQGTARHTPEEIYALANRDFGALSDALGDKPFLFGEAPSSFDATAYAFTISVTAFPADNPIKEFVMSRTNLVSYVDRIQKKYFQAEAATA